MVVLTIASLDATMANVALPAIARDLNIPPGQAVWVMIAYSLAVVVSLLPFSAVAERIGFRRMFALGLTVFMLGAIGCALSSSLATLMPARVAQGFGSSMLMCLFGGLVRNIYPINKLGFGISVNALMVGTMAVLGPPLSAFLLEVASWPWVFGIHIPLCIVAYFGIRFLPDVPTSNHRFDVWACLLSIIGFGLFVWGLDTLVDQPLQAVACMGIAALAAVLLVRRSRGDPAPLVPVDLLRIKPVGYAVAASCCSFAASMSAFVALPFYFLHVLAYSYGETGLLLAWWSVGTAVMAPIAGRLADRHQVAILCGIGATCMAAGILWAALLPRGAGFAWVSASMLLGGVGFGFFQTPNNRAMLMGAPRRRSGAAGGLQATTRVFGQSIGTALAAVGFHLSENHGATLALFMSVTCALAALGINVARYYSREPDLTV